MEYKKWRFRDDMLGHYINGVSSRTFQDAEDRLNYLEEKEQLPDMREKVKEYISELDVEIDRCHKLAEQNIQDESTNLAEMMLVRVQTLTEIKNDLQGRLNELI